MSNVSRGWIWLGRAVFLVIVVGLAVYLANVGLDKASKVASVLGLLVAVAALAAPYLIGRRASANRQPNSDEVEGSGSATANDGGTAVSGVATNSTRTQRNRTVRRSGPAQADGPGSRAISGISDDHKPK